MDNVPLIKLTGPQGEEVFVNCNKVQYLEEDNSTQRSMTLIHLHGGTSVLVREGIHGVAKQVKCPNH